MGCAFNYQSHQKGKTILSINREHVSHLTKSYLITLRVAALMFSAFRHRERDESCERMMTKVQRATDRVTGSTSEIKFFSESANSCFRIRSVSCFSSLELFVASKCKCIRLRNWHL